MAVFDTILKLTRQLYPTGRAFRMPVSGVMEKLHRGLAASESRTYADAVSILNSALPDNIEFTADDATDWERRLGLVSRSSVSLDDRKLAIKRKMAHPGTIHARQNYLYIQAQLQAAGFDVFVHENRFDDGIGGYTTKTPADAGGPAGVVFQHGDAQHGDFQHGSIHDDIIANYVDEDLDAVFDVGGTLRFTFFICGEVLGDVADVDADRKDEFRQLILRLKPAHTAGYLFINYI